MKIVCLRSMVCTSVFLAAAAGLAPSAIAADLKVGTAKVIITPEVDKQDRPVWMAGFAAGRRATGIHDDLYARAIYLELGNERVAMVALDFVGYFYADVVTCRKLLKKKRPDLANVHVLIAATHNHEGPDTMGIWGPFPLVSGVDREYMRQVREKIVGVIATAADQGVVAHLRFAEARTPGLIEDSRLPRVIHDTIQIMHARGAYNGQSIGSILLWHSHPEALGSKNTEITVDFSSMPSMRRNRLWAAQLST